MKVTHYKCLCSPVVTLVVNPALLSFLLRLDDAYDTLLDLTVHDLEIASFEGGFLIDIFRIWLLEHC